MVHVDGAAGFIVRAKVFITDPEVAASVAVCADRTVATVAVKPTLADPDGTVTLAGTVTDRLLVEIVTASPPLPAAPVKLTVQATEPGEVTELEPHERALSTEEICVIVTALPVPVPLTPVPAPVDEDTDPTVIDACESGAAAAIVTVAVATFPLAMTF
jgi:hypothetical protein